MGKPVFLGPTRPDRDFDFVFVAPAKRIGCRLVG